MPDAREDAAIALAFMREWDWTNFNPDYSQRPPGMDLNSIVSRLAVEGLRRPETIMLHMFCNGQLLARGYYRWSKHQDGQSYQYESSYEPIRPRYWQNLSDNIQAASAEAENSYTVPKVTLGELGIRDCPRHDWDHGNSSFSYAVRNGSWYDEDYLEEWFSAWDIEAWPRFLTEPKSDAIDQSIDVFGADEPKSSRGRSAAKWWPDFAEELALTVYMEGIPEGAGHEGQSELLDKVLTRLSAAGKPEPGRATVQPVINAVLARIRSAGK